MPAGALSLLPALLCLLAWRLSNVADAYLSENVTKRSQITAGESVQRVAQITGSQP